MKKVYTNLAWDSEKQRKEIKKKAIDAGKTMNQYILDCIELLSINTGAKSITCGDVKIPEAIVMKPSSHGEGKVEVDEFIKQALAHPDNQKPFDPDKNAEEMVKKFIEPKKHKSMFKNKLLNK